MVETSTFMFLQFLLTIQLLVFSSQVKGKNVFAKFGKNNELTNHPIHHGSGITQRNGLMETETIYDNIAETGSEDNIESNDANTLFEGDIILNREQRMFLLMNTNNRAKRQAMKPTAERRLWDQPIPYRFNSNFPNNSTKYVLTSIKQIETLTCVRFKAIQKGTDGNYPHIMEFTYLPRVSCSAPVGMSTDPVQQVFLGARCANIRSAIHELLHPLGLFHTHMRIDRDNYITMKGDSLGDPQYRKLDTFTNDNLGVPYDYGSVMHYSDIYHLEAKDPLYEPVLASSILSFYDVLSINRLYKCTDKCASSNIVCTNGGYPNPNDCSTCNCPNGYGGRLCNELPKDGVEIQLNPLEKKTINEIYPANYPNLRGWKSALDDTAITFRTYWIKAPTNMRIKITVHSVYTTYNKCLTGCQFYGIEIKTGEDQANTGYRFCCKGEFVIRSNSSMVPIIVYNRQDLPLFYTFSVETDGCLPYECNGGFPFTTPGQCHECLCDKGDNDSTFCHTWWNGRNLK